jgi:hypothetical protein
MEEENGGEKIKLPNFLRTLHERDQEKRLIVVLENASLETVKVGYARVRRLVPSHSH